MGAVIMSALGPETAMVPGQPQPPAPQEAASAPAPPAPPAAGRLPGWELRLAAALEEARHRPFAWGSHDCVSWAAAVRTTLTGRPTPWPGRWRTRLGAARVLRRTGHRDLAGAVRSVLGAPLPTVRLAARGDVVLIEIGDRSGAASENDDTNRNTTAIAGQALGICIGAEAGFVAPRGLIRRRLLDCAFAWRI